MEITILDFILINIISYGFGVSTGLIICFKYKNRLLNNNNLDTLNLNNPIIPALAQPSAPAISEIILKQ